MELGRNSAVLSHSMIRRSAVVLAVVVGVVLLPLLPSAARGVFANVVVAAFAVTVLVTACIGIAVTAILPPLRPVSESSILGRRVVALTKWSLAAGALFGAAYVSWMISATFDSAQADTTRFSEATGLLMNVLWGLLAFAAFVYCVWLSVDLLRVGRRRRLNAVDAIIRRAERLLEVRVRWARKTAHTLVASPIWILVAFYGLPVAVVMLFEFGRSSLQVFPY
ncbi:hypothetical protein [Agromyces sp. NPDC056965]|uniref:hypothetical protein n=1 Tax=Agromyces sp. NPDC056965 TaxID=3345983 RepID=UPI0036322A25